MNRRKKILQLFYLNCLVLCLLISLQMIGYSQGSIQLEFVNDLTRNKQIHALQKSKVAFASINDLASAFRFTSNPINENHQFEFQAKEYKVRVTSGNPFISITDAKNSTSIIQLPFDVEYSGSDYVVPVESFIDMFDDLTTEEMVYDRTNAKIIIGKAQAQTTTSISKVTVEQKSNGYLLRIVSPKRINDYESWLKPVDDATWLYITLPNTKADLRTLNSNKPGGVVKDLLAYQSPTSLQLTFKLGTKVSNTEVIQSDGNNDLLVAIHTPKEEVKTTKLEETLERTRNRWKLDCIVIDAGHGGQDPGTLGVKKTKEKDVTLAIALKLGRIFEQYMSDVKVVYTRKTDQFIELYKRGQIANAAGGKLFISIHCNATPRKPSSANGFEVYLLRPGKTETAVHIASRENEVVKLENNYQDRYKELTEEQFILVTMAQNAYVRYSEQFAGHLQDEMKRLLPEKNNGVKQAGFYVLVGASMPNVLIETGYLSNKKEEQYLASSKGQDQLAAAIFQGVKKYKTEYEKSLEEGVTETEKK